MKAKKATKKATQKSTQRFKPQAVLTLVRQPTSIAAIASVGIHAILFAASPQLSQLSLASLANPDDLDRERTVPLVELSPEEQNRLPDFSNRRFSLIPEDTDISPFQFPVGSSPSNIGASNRPGLGQIGVQRGVFGGSGFGSQGTSTYIGGGAGVRSSGGQVGAGAGVQSGVGQGQPQAGATGAQENPTGEAQTGGGLREIQPDDVARLTNPSDLAFELAGEAENPEETPDAAPESTNEDEATPRSLADARPQSTEASDLFAEELAALEENYTYDATGTTPEFTEEKMAQWLGNVRTAAGNPELEPSDPIELPIDYPLALCLTPPPSNAQLGIVIGGGEALAEPFFIKRTGYLGLDQLAYDQVIAKTQAEDFPELEAFSALLFDVPVKYDAENCVDVPADN